MAKLKKKKIFFEVEVPILKKIIHLIGYDLSDLDNRVIKYDLTRILKGKSTILSLKVKVENNSAVAYPIKIQILQTFLKRVMRKRVNYVEDSFSIQCKDAKLRVKPFLITRKKVSRRVRKALREETKEYLKDNFKDKDSETLFKEIIKNQIQKPLSLKLKKIYPLSFCEIRILKVEKFI